MDLRPTAAQTLLRQAARGLLKDWTTEHATANVADTTLWTEMVRLGWTALPFPTSAGGIDGDLLDTGILLREIGRAGVSTPLFQTLAAGIVINRLGAGPGADALVQRIAQGETCAALLAVAEAERLPTLEERDGHLALVGGPYLVELADTADTLVVPARTTSGHIALLSVDTTDSGFKRECLATIDDEPVARVDLCHLRVRDSALLTTSGVPTASWLEALSIVALLRAAEMTGGAEKALELTVQHVRTREQFGRALGTFQAVQHLCADMAMYVDGATLAVYEGLWIASAGLDCARSAASASYFAGEAAEQVTIRAAEAHGGIGYTMEYPLQRLYRRAKGQRLRMGSNREQLLRVMKTALRPQRSPTPEGQAAASSALVADLVGLANMPS